MSAAEALGASRRRVIFRHLLPNTFGPLLVAATLGVGDVILLEAGLSFLGLGVQPPTPSWGGMILDGEPYSPLRPGPASFPASPSSSPSCPPTCWATPSATPSTREAHDPSTRSRTSLRISFPDGEGGRFLAVDGVSFTLDRGETLAIVGRVGVRQESHQPGAPPPGATARSYRGRAAPSGSATPTSSPSRANRSAGFEVAVIGMVFQDPMTSPQSGAHRRRPDRRGHSRALQGHAGRGPGPRVAAAAGGGNPRRRRRGSTRTRTSSAAECASG